MSALGGIGSATLVRRRRLGPAPLWLLALPIGGVLLLPLAFVGVQASGAGWAKAIHLLRLPHVDELLRNTVELVVLVPPLCASGTIATTVLPCFASQQATSSPMPLLPCRGTAPVRASHERSISSRPAGPSQSFHPGCSAQG